MNLLKKNKYRAVIIFTFVVIITLLIFVIGQTWFYLNSGADRSSMLRLTLQKKDTYQPKVNWIDTLNPGRPMEEQTLRDIKKDYLRAWHTRQIAFQTYDTTGVTDYYTSNARQNIVKVIEANKQQEVTIGATTINHNLLLDFYSADGQLVVLTDKEVKEFQRVYQKDQILHETSSTSDYKMILLLEDGFWRIRHFVKEKIYPTQKVINTPVNTFLKNQHIYLDKKKFTIKGVNYYPQNTPWDMFGNQFNISIIQKDFEKIKNMGLNTLRIFIPYEDFGKENVSKEQLKKLQQVLDAADKLNLKVIVTLFDFYGNYEILDWTITHRHAEQIVSHFKSHKAILAWDIKNEPDLDFESRGKENVLGWLCEMILQVKKFDPNHFVTIGWSDIDAATLLSDELDIVSFHYYKDPDDFIPKYTSLTSKISKPLVLQEFGIPSYRGFWNPFGTSEKQQASYYQKFQKIQSDHNLHNLFWTLYDFEKIPDKVTGSLPWRKQRQKHFGVIDSKGERKKAFKYVTY